MYRYIFNRLWSFHDFWFMYTLPIKIFLLYTFVKISVLKFLFYLLFLFSNFLSLFCQKWPYIDFYFVKIIDDENGGLITVGSSSSKELFYCRTFFKTESLSCSKKSIETLNDNQLKNLPYYNKDVSQLDLLLIYR